MLDSPGEVVCLETEPGVIGTAAYDNDILTCKPWTYQPKPRPPQPSHVAAQFEADVHVAEVTYLPHDDQGEAAVLGRLENLVRIVGRAEDIKLMGITFSHTSDGRQDG